MHKICNYLDIISIFRWYKVLADGGQSNSAFSAGDFHSRMIATRASRITNRIAALPAAFSLIVSRNNEIEEIVVSHD